MDYGFGINRRHRKASRLYVLALPRVGFDPQLSAKAGHYLDQSVRRLKGRVFSRIGLPEGVW